MLGQIELAEEFGETFFSKVEILIDFIKKLNVVKISKKTFRCDDWERNY